MCGGASGHMLDKRKVTRAVKRVLAWTDDWSDLSSAPQQQMAPALSKQIIFDKFIRRKNLKYIVDSSAQEQASGSGVFLSIADVALCCIVYPWLQSHVEHSTYLETTIPAVVRYVQNILRELMVLHEQLGLTDPYIFHFMSEKCASPCAIENSWVLQASLPCEASLPFRVKSQRPPSCQLRDQQQETTDRSDEEFDTVVDSLVALVDWEGAGELCQSMNSLSFSDPCPSSSSSSSSISHNVPNNLARPDNATFWEKLQLPPKRKVRKQAQIWSLLLHACRLLPQGGKAVEFCCGGGYVGLALAVLRPDCSVLLTDMNSISLAFAKERVEALQLTNVTILRCELSDWELVHSRVPTFATGLPSFQLGLALHACGTATDAVGRICKRAGASFVLSPCCYGFIQHAAQLLRTSDETVGDCVSPSNGGETSSITDEIGHAPDSLATPSAKSESQHMYPLSERFREAGWEPQWYPRLCRTADHTFWSHDQRAASFNPAGVRAMRLVDTDRLLNFASAGYKVEAHHMEPRDASPKNHILVGQAPLLTGRTTSDCGVVES
jgi:hypothetical protein